MNFFDYNGEDINVLYATEKCLRENYPKYIDGMLEKYGVRYSHEISIEEKAALLYDRISKKTHYANMLDAEDVLNPGVRSIVLDSTLYIVSDTDVTSYGDGFDSARIAHYTEDNTYCSIYVISTISHMDYFATFDIKRHCMAEFRHAFSMRGTVCDEKESAVVKRRILLQ